ncbi:envelope stress response membrane protein PspB [Vibrio breoganii]|uniref:envelope stress response membrane protein PspB n=1 Tax=Vibrio breoganii TaxID=553239 RepID=UPI000319206C|nr:envelope stress response membrane protein PspB [Vibrio breoganii]OED95803.1 phage shock protein B [Vibrio breoganii ZF-55]PMK41272.1 phage shock protein B [Vibrio breoganii]PMO34502.1 phage shock protein B [Vibrio breoganii]PMO59104.1 phage shock protein B [Vibrio breoganii]
MSTALITVPLSVFLIFVAPLWLILHYRSKRKLGQGLSGDEREQLQQLSSKAVQMKQRIETLEKILDAESPNWRSNQ